STADALKRLDGKVWAATVDRASLEKISMDYPILYEQVYNGSINVRVEGEQSPSQDFEPVQPTLDDVYFSLCKAETK
ncbi:MAG: ABC transporter ATP-binding protein, partial [Bacteroidota bacterium]